MSKANAKVTIDREICKGCGLCIAYCPKKLFRIDMENMNSKGTHTAEIEDYSECVLCQSCVRMCPDMAITLEKLD